MLPYRSDFNNVKHFIEHMKDIINLENKQEFVSNMDEATVVQYIKSIAAYALIEQGLGEELTDILFNPIKVKDVKEFACILMSR